MKALLAKTTLYMDPDLHKRLKLLAVEEGKTLTRILEEALRKHVKRYGRKPGRKP